MTFVESEKASLKRLIGDIQNAVSYLNEAWNEPIGSREWKAHLLDATERLDEALDKLKVMSGF